MRDAWRAARTPSRAAASVANGFTNEPSPPGAAARTPSRAAASVANGFTNEPSPPGAAAGST